MPNACANASSSGGTCGSATSLTVSVELRRPARHFPAVVVGGERQRETSACRLPSCRSTAASNSGSMRPSPSVIAKSFACPPGNSTPSIVPVKSTTTRSAVAASRATDAYVVRCLRSTSSVRSTSAGVTSACGRVDRDGRDVAERHLGIDLEHGGELERVRLGGVAVALDARIAGDAQVLRPHRIVEALVDLVGDDVGANLRPVLLRDHPQRHLARPEAGDCARSWRDCRGASAPRLRSRASGTATFRRRSSWPRFPGWSPCVEIPCERDTSRVPRARSGAAAKTSDQVMRVVRKGGLEPPRGAPPAPKAGASTNSATFAARRPNAIARGRIIAECSPGVRRARGAAARPYNAPFASDSGARVSVDHYENFPVASRLGAAAAARSGRRDLPLRARGRRHRRRRRRTAARSALRRWPHSTPRSTRSRAARYPRRRRSPSSPQPCAAIGCRSRRCTTSSTPSARTSTAARYPTYADLLDYCRRSANPVGRLLLALYGRDTAANFVASDAICTALQLTNFWQDVADRLAAGTRLSAARRSGPLRRRRGAAWRAARRRALARLMAFETGRARALLESGRPLVRALPARLGLELSAVIAGGARILERIDAVGGDVFRHRRCSARGTGSRSASARSYRAARRVRRHDAGRVLRSRRRRRAARASTTASCSCRRRGGAAITALYAFCREVDDVVDEVSDPDVARLKLAWWRNEVAAIYAGTPQHPVARALVPVVREFALPQAQLQTVIDGMAMDLEHTRYVDFAALETYCHRVAGVVGLLSARIFGYANEATRRLRARPRHRVPADQHHPRRRRGRAPRPHLPAAGRPRALRRRAVGAPARQRRRRVPRADALPDGARAGMVRRARSRSSTRPTGARSGPGSSWRRSTARCCDEIERDGFHVLDRRIALTPLRKLWIAWKTARTT